MPHPRLTSAIIPLDNTPTAVPEAQSTGGWNRTWETRPLLVRMAVAIVSNSAQPQDLATRHHSYRAAAVRRRSEKNAFFSNYHRSRLLQEPARTSPNYRIMFSKKRYLCFVYKDLIRSCAEISSETPWRLFAIYGCSARSLFGLLSGDVETSTTCSRF